MPNYTQRRQINVVSFYKLKEKIIISLVSSCLMIIQLDLVHNIGKKLFHIRYNIEYLSIPHYIKYKTKIV